MGFMEIAVTARHFKASPELRDHAYDAAQKLGKFYDNIIKVEVILIGDQHKDHAISVEFIAQVDDHTLVVREHSSDFSKCIHDCAEKIIRQLRKLKTKHTRDLHAKKVLLTDEEYI